MCVCASRERTKQLLKQNIHISKKGRANRLSLFLLVLFIFEQKKNKEFRVTFFSIQRVAYTYVYIQRFIPNDTHTHNVRPESFTIIKEKKTGGGGSIKALFVQKRAILSTFFFVPFYFRI